MYPAHYVPLTSYTPHIEDAESFPIQEVLAQLEYGGALVPNPTRTTLIEDITKRPIRRFFRRLAYRWNALLTPPPDYVG
jgi:hypothetical protein